ncbi:MAG: transporter substrate-binding domain-containing protein [Fretibacterium sp.]|nr:transporter substrate-binding domain-containing protein [Fretibacterium sp.]
MKRRGILLLTAAVMICTALCPARADYTHKDQLNVPGVRVGVSMGSISETTVAQELPQAEIVRYNNVFLGYADVGSGRIDAFACDHRQMEMAIAGGVTGVRLLEESLDRQVEIAVGLSQRSAIPELEDRVNLFIAQVRADGTLNDMFDRWVLKSNDAMPDIPVPEDPEFSLVVGTAGCVPPYSYYTGSQLTGYDIELARRFAAWLNARLEFAVYDFNAIIPAAQAGKVDVIMSNLQVSGERRESFKFSDTLYVETQGLMVRDTSMSGLVYGSVSQLDGRRIGVQTGSSFDSLITSALPHSNLKYFNNKADMVNALISGKIDAYAADEPVIRNQMLQDGRIGCIPEYLERFDFAYVFPVTEEGQRLCGQMNEFLSSIRGDGTLEALEQKWVSEDETVKTLPVISSLPAPNGTLRMATEAMYEPFEYVRDGQAVGFDIDVAALFCRASGYGLEVVDMSFDSVLSAVQTGKCSFAGAGIAVTEERKESVLFSSPNYTGGVMLAVLKKDAVSDTGFWQSILSSFEKTFIREARWNLFIRGVVNTLLITFLSMALGTALGFGVFMLCRKGNAAAVGITRFAMWLVQGMPTVVLLMVLYYVVFGNTSIGGLEVAVIGFSLTFASAVFALLKMGVGAVDSGQTAAARALGYPDRRAFFRIILPQALPHILPAYRGETVSLIKATSVVGYIAVQDLTKMGDIVRSRTYEAFFPLIAVTVLYFILEGILAFLVSRISLSFAPKRRTRGQILKGVKTDDQN